MPFHKDIFTNQQVRELKLITLLQEHNSLLDYRKVCHYLNCSFLTLQTEISTLKTFPEIEDMAYQPSHLAITYKEQYGTQKLYQTFLNDSPSLKLLNLLFFAQQETLEELADKLFISLSTLKRLLKKTNSYLSTRYHFSVDVKKLIFVGDEKAIRLFFLKYFSEIDSMDDWPFDPYIPKNILEDLVSFVADTLNWTLDFTHYRHLLIYSAVNLLRSLKGNYQSAQLSNLSQYLDEQLSETEQGKALRQRFFKTFQNPLTRQMIAELFSTFLSEELLSSPSQVSNLENHFSHFKTWRQTLLHLEEEVGFPITNKDEIIMHCHNALKLGNEDAYLNFLVYDYRKNFINHFNQDYPHFLAEVQKQVSLMISDCSQEVSDYTINHLTYLFLMTWDNLFLYLSQHIEKQKLLVVERGKGNVGLFLQAYLGQFFDITIFRDYKLTNLKEKYACDLIITDTLLNDIDGVTILYFNKLTPSDVLARLNDHLRKQLKHQFQEKYERRQLSQLP
ncbi:helix-turn-helix domain-containing protein [Streptococcus hongkongensis]|nr:transcriptional regulator [Streptococcus uberis]